MNPPPPPPPMPPSPYDPHKLEAHGGERPVREVSQFLVLSMNVVNTITQLCLGGVIVCAFMAANMLSSRNEPGWFGIENTLSQHIYLCTTGYFILMSQAILTLNPHAGWANSLMHPKKRVIHWFMQIGGATLALAGSIVKLTDSEDNFTSPHGIVGLVALLLTLLNLVGGFICCPKPMQTKLLKTCHGATGTFTIIMAFVTICLKFDDEYYREQFLDSGANMAIVLSSGAVFGLVIVSCTKIVIRLTDE